MDWNMVDVASGGALMDKTPVIARHLISNMAIDGANIPCEAARCRTTSTKHATSVWYLHLSRAPYRYVPHFVGGIACQHYKSDAVDRFRKHPLVDDLESERGRSRHHAALKR
ncbi:hypothetical protein CR513_17697, partial [Mucuna pruriens]